MEQQIDNRTVAINIASRILQKVFERVWLPWSPAMDRAIERFVDAVIAAAVERVQHPDMAAFERQLEDAYAYTGETFKEVSDQDTDQGTASDREQEGLARFREWQEARRRA